MRRLATPAGDVEIGTGRDSRDASERRTLRIDGAPAKSHGALCASISAVVWLTPSMDRLFVDGSSARRRFLDRLVLRLRSASTPSRLNAYEQAMRERARLLRDGPMDPSWLAALEETMADDRRRHRGGAARGDGAARPGLRRGGGAVSGGAPRARGRDRGAAGEPAGARRRGANSARRLAELARSRPRERHHGAGAAPRAISPCAMR